MNESINNTQMQALLALFTDGQLDNEKTLLALEYLAVNPAAIQQMIHGHQLRQAVNRVMRRQAPDAPEALKLKIQQLAQDSPLQETSEENISAALPQDQKEAASTRPILAQIARWGPLAGAAIFLVAAMVTLSVSGQDQDPVSQARYAKFVYRHNGCSDQSTELKNRHLFIQNLQQLPATLTEYLGGSLATGLDLSKIGYEFYAVGECSVPGNRSVHLIYRAKIDTSNTLSLWIRRYKQSLDIEPNRPYLVMGQDITHPLLLWTQGDMIYYLVGNSLTCVESAANVLQASYPSGSKQTESNGAGSTTTQVSSISCISGLLPHSSVDVRS